MSDTPQTREERVTFIMRQMAADPPEWPKPGTPESPEHRRTLAVAWGCAEATIRDYAAEASRNLRADPLERDYLRYLVAKRFDRISGLAEVPHGDNGKPDWRAAIEALDKFAEYMGLKEAEAAAREPLRVTIVDAGSEDPAGADPEAGIPGSGTEADD